MRLQLYILKLKMNKVVLEIGNMSLVETLCNEIERGLKRASKKT